jgi:hypothetical protein
VVANDETGCAAIGVGAPEDRLGPAGGAAETESKSVNP